MPGPFSSGHSVTDARELAANLGIAFDLIGITPPYEETVRTLESARGADGKVQAQEGATDLFIYPPYEFRMVDVLLTNFHLPRSTLVMLVSAFASREFLLRAYEEAIRQRYRFYSYGDCMLIL